jgi:hypothetical protein
MIINVYKLYIYILYIYHKFGGHLKILKKKPCGIWWPRGMINLMVLEGRSASLRDGLPGWDGLERSWMVLGSARSQVCLFQNSKAQLHLLHGGVRQWNCKLVGFKKKTPPNGTIEPQF